MRLPVQAAPPAPAPPPPVESLAAPPCHVVLADDSAGFTASCARLLRRFGHEVLLAGDGEEALKLVHEVRPDVLLLDVRLPGLDGYEVARRLRSAPGLEGVRIAGFDEVDQAAAAGRPGARPGRPDFCRGDLITAPSGSAAARGRGRPRRRPSLPA